MLITLDAQPQEWMAGAESVSHTVAACQFKSLEHAEYWSNKLIPRNKNGGFVKWAGGRRKNQTRKQFIENCHKYSDEIDFKVNCVSSIEGEMSWFAWAFYMQNRTLVTQQVDTKGRNCLVFPVSVDHRVILPVLRAGYLIWYYHVVRYLVEVNRANGLFLSDNFCNDEEGPGDSKARAVAFVNFLLSQSNINAQISLPTNDRLRQCDHISDYFCGWVNSVRSGVANSQYALALNVLEQHSFIDNITLATDLTITDENGNDITEQTKAAVSENSENFR